VVGRCGRARSRRIGEISPIVLACPIPLPAAYARLAADRGGGGHRYDLQRLGHAKPNVTLAIYAHMFKSDDGRAAAAINAALNSPIALALLYSRQRARRALEPGDLIGTRLR
jgi:hypothetical protein